MPLSKYEEQRVVSHVWHSSDSIAGIPIKKRRFLLVRSPSHPPVTPQVESHKEELIVKPVSPSKNAGDPTEVSNFAGGTQNSLPEREELSDSRNVNLVKNAFSYSDLGGHDQTLPTVFGSEVDSECKLLLGNTGLELVSHRNLAPIIDEKVNDKVELSLSRTGGKADFSGILENSELLFAPKLSLQMASFGDNSEGSSKYHEILDPHIWNLDLPKGQNCSKNGGEAELSGNSPTNRSHWDLNTTMDSWGDNVNDSASSPRTDGLDMGDSAGVHDIKCVIGPPEKVSCKQEFRHISLGKDLLNKSYQCSKPTVNQPYRPDDLNLGLHPSVPHPGLAKEVSCFATEVDSGRVISTPISPEKLVLPSKLVDLRVVKSEPSDERIGQKLVAKVADPRVVLGRIVDQGAVKSEQGSSDENLKSRGKISMQMGIHSADFGVSTRFVVPTGDLGIPAMEGGQKVSNNGSVASDLLSQLVCPDGKDPKSTDDLPELPSKESPNITNPVQSNLSATAELHVDSLGNGEMFESDEKVNSSADEEISYDIDEESDSNQVTGDPIDTEDQPNGLEAGYREGGEFIEPHVSGATKDVLCSGEEAKHVDVKSISFCNFPCEEATSLDVQDMDTKMEETEHSDFTEQHDNTVFERKSEQDQNIVAHVEETLTVPLPNSENEKNPIDDFKPLDPTKIDPEKCHIAILSSDSVISEVPIPGDGNNVAVCSEENGRRTSPLGSSCSDLSKIETGVNSGEEPAKDIIGKCNRSRIINLSRASNVPLSGATKAAQDRVLTSKSQGERFGDAVLRSHKLHARGSRGRTYQDHRFERRNQNQLFGSNKSDFRPGRGRADNRLRNLRGKWDSDHDFSTEQSNRQIGIQFSRFENTGDSANVECRDFVETRGVKNLGTGRGRGRKRLADELPSFRHPVSRRRSPGGEEGHVSRGMQTVCRAPRDLRPDRCIAEEDSDFIGLRHEEKFMRGLPGEGMKTVFPRGQPQFDQVDDSFDREDRSFSPLQRRIPRYIPQGHPKSSPQPRRHSGGSWSSPRRTSDGFVEHEEMERTRSPHMYRNGRMRSPHGLPCFAEELVVRRHNSPQYIPRKCNDTRDIGSSREQDQHRSYIRSRSPSGRILARTTRRFEMVDPRERDENEDLFPETVHSSRFHDIVRDVVQDGRRKCSERRRPVRSFCPPYGSDVTDIPHHVEDDPRSYRLCPEDSEFHERGNSRGRGFGRGNLRGREFDGRMKNQSDAPRTRNIEEQEENYWETEQDWHDADLEDSSRMRRRRF